MLELLSGTRVDLAHSAARHGEGLFETIRVRDGAPARLGAHLERLAAGARFLGLEPPPGPDAVRDFLAARGVCAGLERGVLRLLAVDGKLLTWAAPWEPGRQGPIQAALSREIRRLSDSPLNRFKTLSYLENRLLAREAGRRGLFEALALNEAGRLTDGSRTTLFVVLGGRLLTPPASDGALPGVARRCLLEAGLAEEAPLVQADLARAEALLLSNALQGAVPVHACPDCGPLDAGHPLLARAAELLG
ncbi:MAG: aminotransferase class IV [Holophaga sp.]|jgi:branched-chain amino acid aminotransferase